MIGMCEDAPCCGCCGYNATDGIYTRNDPGPPRCHCGLYMTNREAAEQGECNDCFQGAYDPYGNEEDE